MPDDQTREITLARPVSAYGELVAKVTLRRPTVKELRECGQPYTIGSTGANVALQANYEACASLLTRVCTPPLPAMAIDELDSADFDDMAMILVGFSKPARPGQVGGNSSQSSS